MNRITRLSLTVGGGALTSALLVGAVQIGRQKRMQAYYRELLAVLQRAIGQHRGTVEAIAILNPLAGAARDLLTERPQLAVSDAAELHTDITFTCTHSSPEWLDVIISGPSTLVRFLASRLKKDDHGLDLLISAVEETEGMCELTMSVNVVSEEDAELLESVRRIVCG